MNSACQVKFYILSAAFNFWFVNPFGLKVAIRRSKSRNQRYEQNQRRMCVWHSSPIGVPPNQRHMPFRHLSKSTPNALFGIHTLIFCFGVFSVDSLLQEQAFFILTHTGYDP